MKKLLYILLLSGIAFAGFTLGRATGMPGMEEIPQINHSYPLPPPPPESTPYEPGLPETDGTSDQGIVIETPVDGARISETFAVTGRALTATGRRLVIVVRDESGATLVRAETDIDAAPGERYGRFDEALGPFGAAGEGTVEVSRLGDDGAETDTQVKHVEFVEPDTVDVRVYFQNSTLDPSTSCDLVFPVTREVSSKTQIYRAAIEALLGGPNAEELEAGYNTSLPQRVTLRSVAADADGTVRADFDDRLDRGVGGSCRVIAIREQIERTLKQFPEVREVVISVEGEVDEALQP